MKKPIKVLYINGNIMKRGGIESFMMNYYRKIDPQKVKIDFLVHGYEVGEYDEEILNRGSKIYHVPTKSKHPMKYRKELYKIFSSGEYQIVHSHCDAISGWILQIAAKAGIPIRIAHSHNTATLTRNKIKLLINDYYKKQIPKYATHMFACSKAAGEWMFGSNSKFEVIPNAIELEKYAFSKVLRDEVRKKFNCEEKYVVGHIGRFDYQKNHSFIIELWREIAPKHKKFKLMLVGGGDLKDEIERKIGEYKLEDSIIFTGVQENTSPFYSAFDSFILPSHFEGLPVVAVEAQANGLSCYLSKNITDEVCLTNLVERIDITGIEGWTEALEKNASSISLSEREERSSLAVRDIEEAKYGIVTAAQLLQEFYEGQLK